MNYTNIFIKMGSAALIVGSIGTVNALTVSDTAKYFNGPSVTSISPISAELSIPNAVSKKLSDQQKASLHFEYIEKDLVCIAIYPTPESCLPKKTKIGNISAIITDLKPNTTYTATYKYDTGIRCVTAPCPADFQSLAAEFTTLGKSAPLPESLFSKYLYFGSRGGEVLALQNFLIEKGYLNSTATGYFGKMTVKAVKDFQTANGITPTGGLGPITRSALKSAVIKNIETQNKEEFFSGVITAYSTACFADGECSITVDDKKIVTTIGWTNKTVGTVKGIPDFGSIEKYVGKKATVFAKKTESGYTLYGKAEYYIDIESSSALGKLPGGSTPSGDLSKIKDRVWIWQTITNAKGVVTSTAKADRFTFTLSEDNQVSGTTDCNNFFGKYSLASDGFITFGPFGSTRMFCENSNESIFLDHLTKVSRIVAGESNSLTLNLTDGSTMTFVGK